MSKYEFSLEQEVLMEKGASILGDLLRYERDHNISDDNDPITVMFSLIWNAKQDILCAESEQDLAEIEGKFNLANRFLARIEGSVNA